MTLRTCAALAALCLLAGAPPPEHTRSCEVTVTKVPVGVEHWHCDFADYPEDTLIGQADACWTEDGSLDSLAENVRAG